MADFILIGGGGHARVLLHVLRRLGHHVMGFSAPTSTGARVPAPYLGNDKDLAERVDSARVQLAFAHGKVGTDPSRLRVLEALIQAGFRRIPPIVAPTATLHDDAALGDAGVVLDGAVVYAGTPARRAK